MPAGFPAARAGSEFFQDQEVPLLVILLGPRLRDLIMDAAGKPGALRYVRDRDVGDLLPALIGNVPSPSSQYVEVLDAIFRDRGQLPREDRCQAGCLGF
jgi:hypothetical protein